MKIPMQMKKSTCPGYFPKTGTLHARSGARTLDTLIKRGDRIVMIIRLTKGDIGNTIVMLSRPIWQQKGGVEFWIFWFLLFFPLWQV